MPSEDELRELLRSNVSAPTLDADRIVTESRRRRRPRQVAAGALGALAIAGITVIAVPALTAQPDATFSAAESADQGMTAEGGAASDSSASTLKRAPADDLNLCGAPLAVVESSPIGLELDVAFAPTAPTGSTAMQGVVRLTNGSDEVVTGTTAITPALTLSQDGVTVWHSPSSGDLSAVAVNLAPGEFLEYDAYFEPVRCDAEDDSAEQFRPDLPPVAPGTYELSAAIDFAPADLPAADSLLELELIASVPEPILLE